MSLKEGQLIPRRADYMPEAGLGQFNSLFRIGKLSSLGREVRPFSQIFLC